MPRQYRILYRQALDPPSKFLRLRPQTDEQLYDQPEVKTAIDFMSAHPAVEGVAVRLGDELFNIVSFVQEAEAPQAFLFPAT